MSFPSTFSSFSQPTASSHLNSPSHSALHNSVSSAVGQLEAVVGLDNAGSVLGTVIGDLRSPSSGGGGHVQTANKGGTGQTTYTTGDMLVASSSSVLSKIAVGADGQVLTANSSVAGGVNWSGLNKVAISITSVAAGGATLSSAITLFAASVAGNLLGSSGAIRYTGEMRQLGTLNNAAGNFNLTVNYGNNTICTAVASMISGNYLTTGKVEGYIFAKGSPSSQLGYVTYTGFRYNNGGATGSGIIGTSMLSTGLPPLINLQANGTSSVASQNSQNLVISGNFDGSTGSVLAGTFIVEKIA